jgi:hypothetical protein
MFMLKQLLFSLFILFSLAGAAQEIPAGSCGLLCHYDAAGNRISQEYYCNNTPRKETQPDALSAFEAVEALYPNPTTGKFFITFKKALDNVLIKILDVNGRTVENFRASGSRVEVSLTDQPSGIYFIVINDAGTLINKKVVKQ